MNNREFLIARRKAERAAFIKVFKALPEARLDYRPDPRSRNAAELAWAIASEEADLAAILETGRCDFEIGAPPKSAVEILAAYERNAGAVDRKLAQADDARWADKGQFCMGGNPVWETTIGEFAWGFLFDAIHHRGQLSTYLRPMGGKVPSIYGPSADDTGQ
jgi:uncharacterized damage-inducible protein DinB